MTRRPLRGERRIERRSSSAPAAATRVEFLVSANPGQPLKSLAKVASGGELSRISLAVQVAAASGDAALCMVFDEVDAGIGGAVAEIVGPPAARAGRACAGAMRHPSRAGRGAGAQHFRVTKLSDGKATRTVVKTLSAAERIDEIARMSGGIDITEQARAHAREMLARSADAQPAKKKRAPAARQ